MPAPTDQMLARYIGRDRGAPDVHRRHRRGRRRTKTATSTTTGAGARSPAPATGSTSVNEQLKPLEESRRIVGDSARADRASSRSSCARPRQPPAEGRVPLRRRSTSLDYWRAGLGDDEAARAARAVQPRRRPPDHRRTTPACCRSRSSGRSSTSSTTPGRSSTAFGPRQLPSGSWSRPQVTQHTNVAVQSGGEDRARRRRR